ncbi:AAA domain-containing protein [Candidatus Halobonum tyrrellensis]|uniref:DNA helicase n=1 Tax=Candidatus Halobonum tyrrellensis G22 TaxID=1324957 RepID=V4HDV0_9EURY|nr:AAA domain-containing protein [Candidatus Halobonum tyrrellensis]ESP88830.1 DNA/RNA helicase, superfamily i [Candidatus Halobonum tyrrellensis G22]
MNVRGPVLEVGEVRSVDTRYGERDVAELTVRPDGGASAPVDVTLWGKWTHTAEHAEPGMELLVTDAERDDYGGEEGYTTSKESYVVLEPDFLVDVTDVRSWVQCPRMYYLNKLSGIPLNYPVVKGTVVHEVFGDLLRGVDLDDAVADRVAEAGLQLGLLGYERDEVEDEVRRNAAAIEGWLAQGTLTGDGGGDAGANAGTSDAAGDTTLADWEGTPDEDEWRSEYTLISPTFGVKGRADALRQGMPVELKTGKNTNREPRFQDKIQAACYALLLRERGVDADTGTLLYTKNTALDRAEATGDLSPAKEFSVGKGLLDFVVRTRNEIAAMEFDASVPTGFEADARCEYCFEQDTCMVVSGRLDQESKAGRIGEPLPAEEREYIDRLYGALEAERRETHAEYRKLWEQTPAERAADDRALIGLEPLGREELGDGRWRLRARKEPEAVSKLRAGDVALASDGDPVSGHAELGRIETLGEEVTVTTDEPVDLRRLDVYPSELSVDRMLTALHDAVLKGDPDRKDVLFGRRDPVFSEPTDETYVDNNAAQDEAVRRAVAAEDFALVHGPPGTGKTYTIARVVRALVERGDRVLLSAFTNRAVDNALEALREQGFEGRVASGARPDGDGDGGAAGVVRVGTETGVRADMQDVRLVQRGEPNDRAAALNGASVVAATTATCGSRVMREQSFDVALVDEASQLTEPGTLAAVNLADRFVLVGDHEQLPPVVRADTDLRRSLFERLIDDHPEAGTMLDRQYRMSQRIQAFSSAEFYDGALRPATGEVAGRTLADLGVDTADLPAELRDPVSFVDPDGRREGNANPREAERVARLVEAYVDAGVSREDIGVIAPFRAQVAEIGRRTDVTVDTVDRFQGSSEEVVVVSFVATGGLDSPIFEDHRRVNVALTRAKRACCLVGDAAALSSDPFYARMLEWARR